MLSTIHTVDGIEVVTRFRKLGISSYDIGSVLATTIAQRLVRRICPKCARKRDFTQQELDVFKTYAKRFNVEYDLEGKTTFEPVGCEHCNNTGFYGRIVLRKKHYDGHSRCSCKGSAASYGQKVLRRNFRIHSHADKTCDDGLRAF